MATTEPSSTRSASSPATPGVAAFLAVADFLAASVELATAPDGIGRRLARALEDKLNRVRAGPTRSRSRRASAEVSPGTLAVLDRIAGMAEQFDGVTITIEGHTDSDGELKENQVLSEQRAPAVLLGLAAGGGPGADLTSVGLGATRPSSSAVPRTRMPVAASNSG